MNNPYAHPNCPKIENTPAPKPKKEMFFEEARTIPITKELIEKHKEAFLKLNNQNNIPNSNPPTPGDVQQTIPLIDCNPQQLYGKSELELLLKKQLEAVPTISDDDCKGWLRININSKQRTKLAFSFALIVGLIFGLTIAIALVFNYIAYYDMFQAADWSPLTTIIIGFTLPALIAFLFRLCYVTPIFFLHPDKKLIIPIPFSECRGPSPKKYLTREYLQYAIPIRECSEFNLLESIEMGKYISCAHRNQVFCLLPAYDKDDSILLCEWLNESRQKA